MNHEITDKPWTKDGTDLFKIPGKTYLIVVDYYSKYFEINKLLNNTSPIVIKHMKAMFARHGFLKQVFSDYGPGFTSLEFEKFSANWDFEHDTSSPEFALSNGMVERTIQTVKRTLLRCLKPGDDNYLALLALCTAPGKENIPSLATKRMKYELRILLPRVTDLTYQDKVRKQTLKLSQTISPEHQWPCPSTWWQNLVKKEEGNRETWSTQVISHPNRKWPKTPSQQTTSVSRRTIKGGQDFLFPKTNKRTSPRNSKTQTNQPQLSKWSKLELEESCTHPVGCLNTHHKSGQKHSLRTKDWDGDVVCVYTTLKSSRL